MSLGVVIPAFNEAATIDAVLEGLPGKIDGHDVVVIVVDDGSTDDTAAIAERRDVTVIRSAENVGKGCALRTGMEETAPLDLDAVVWMDSDGQHLPGDLEAVAAPVLKGSADMVVGSRYMSPAVSKAPLNRRMVRGATIPAIRAATGITLTDPFSGYRSFSPRATASLDLKGDCYESELEALFSVWRSGLVVEETPISRIYGRGTSKMGFHRGKLLGRIHVIRGYVRTILRAVMTRSEKEELVSG
jgi:glycosyltransferase involved in cell wall biosynthesis